jgi:putative peptidoglycan lipid II flippase
MMSKNIALKSILITAFTFAANAIGLIFHVLLASAMGVSEALDEFYVIISASLFFLGLVIASMNFSLVPILTSASTDDFEFTSESSRSLVFFCIAGVIIFCFGYVFMPTIYKLFYGLEGNDVLVRWVWTSTGLLVFLNSFACILNARQQQTFAASLALWPALMMVLSLYLFFDFGLQTIPQGQCIGAFISIAFAVTRLKKVGFTFKLEGLKRSFLSGGISGRIILSVGAMACFSSYAVIDSFWAPQISLGALSQVTIAQRFMISLGNFSVAAASVLMIPSLVQHYSCGAKKSFFAELWSWLRHVLLGGVAFAIGLFFYGDLIVNVMFVRGDFSAGDADVISSLMLEFLPGNLCMLLSVLVFRALFILEGGYKVAFFLSSYWTLSYLFLSGLLLSEGVSGLAFAYLLSWSQVLIMALGGLNLLFVKDAKNHNIEV